MAPSCFPHPNALATPERPCCPPSILAGLRTRLHVHLHEDPLLLCPQISVSSCSRAKVFKDFHGKDLRWPSHEKGKCSSTSSTLVVQRTGRISLRAVKAGGLGHTKVEFPAMADPNRETERQAPIRTRHRRTLHGKGTGLRDGPTGGEPSRAFGERSP